MNDKEERDGIGEEEEESLMGAGGAAAGATRPLWLYGSDAHVWLKVAGVSGFAALALGSYGAHGFKPNDPAYKDIYQTGNIYHLAHTAALLAAPLTKRPNLFGGFLSFGIVAFSGACYTAALLEDKKWSATAPAGGFSFMAAWLSLLF